MALVLADRVRETTTTTGTGTISLAGPVSGFQGFSTAIGNANTTYYTIVDAATGAWEVGLGTYTASGSTLARTTVLSSSNSDALVSFGAGTKDVFVTQPAERAVYVLGAGTGLAAGAAAFTANGVPYADSTSTLATSSNLAYTEGGSNQLTVTSASAAYFTSTVGVNTSYFGTNGTGTYVGSGTNVPVVFYQNNTEGMRLTSTGLSLTANPTLSGGTANGVAYLNGSKVLTTGSALTFDGNNLSIGANGQVGSRLTVIANGAMATFNTGAAADGRIEYAYNGTNIFYTGVNSASLMMLMARSGVELGFGANNSEQMRLTSTGLGIGTSSPSVKLNVAAANPTNGVVSLIQNISTSGQTGALVHLDVGNVGSSAVGIPGGTSNALAFYVGGVTSGSERARIDASGNLGLGVTPSAWESTAKAFQFGSLGYVARGSSGQTMLGYNNYLNTSNQYIYSATSQASRYEQISGEHRFFNAASGTAGNAITFTQAMTLHASGGLSVGSTSDPGANSIALTKLTLSVDSPFVTGANINSGSNTLGLGSTGAVPVIFFTNNTERARIDSSGNLLVGTTSSDGSRLRVYGSYQTLGDGAYEGLIGKASSLVSGGGSGDFAIRSAANMVFATNGNTERARITSGGDLLVGTQNTPAINVKGSALQSFSDQGRLAIGATVSTADLAYFYSSTALAGAITVSGSTCSYTSFSDYRLKDSIAPLTGALAKVAALKPVTYKWKADGSDGEGFIAHELQAVVPQCVTGEKDAVGADGKPVYQGIDTSFLVATLTAAIQELNAKVQTLEAQLKGA